MPSGSGATKQPLPKDLNVFEPTAHIAARRHHHTSYCSRCDLLVGLDGLHVTVVEFDREVGLLTVRVESARARRWAARPAGSSHTVTAEATSRWSTRCASTGRFG